MQDAPHQKGNNHDDINIYRKQIFDCQMAFVKMPPIVLKTNQLALNAEIASGKIGFSGLSFGIIAREMGTIVSELEKLVTEINHLFSSLSQHCALWIKTERTLSLLERMLTLAKRGQTPHPVSLDKVGPKNLSDQPQFNDLYKTTLKQMNLEITTSLKNLNAHQEDVSKSINKLNALVERIAWVAVRQSHYTAITATIEAAKLKGTADLTEIASAIKTLSEEIAYLEKEARDQIFALISKTQSININKSQVMAQKIA